MNPFEKSIRYSPYGKNVSRRSASNCDSEIGEQRSKGYEVFSNRDAGRGSADQRRIGVVLPTVAA